MSLAHRLASVERATILRVTAASLLAAAQLGCDGGGKRDQHYGTDAGSDYQGPPPVTIFYDGGSTTPLDAVKADAPNADAAKSADATDSLPLDGSAD
jgi:hypothetical protein